MLFSKSDLLPFMLPAMMYLFGSADILTVVKWWLFIVVITSIMFGFIGLNAGHHNTETIHEGDTIR